jgi:hypothetical protein
VLEFKKGTTMNTRNLVSTVVLATLAAGCSVFATAGPAAAALSQCNNGYFCVWKDANYGGSYFGVIVKVKEWRTSTNAGVPALVNNDSALANRTVYNQTIYKSPYYISPTFCAMPTLEINLYQQYDDNSESSYNTLTPWCAAEWVA